MSVPTVDKGLLVQFFDNLNKQLPLFYFHRLDQTTAHQKKRDKQGEARPAKVGRWLILKR